MVDLQKLATTMEDSYGPEWPVLFKSYAYNLENSIINELKDKLSRDQLEALNMIHLMSSAM